MRATILPAALLLFGLAACSSTGSLDYTPTGTVAPGPAASVSAVVATDQRDEKPNRLATVRGGYGNPVYVLDTPQPVADQVAAAFTKALQARGMMGSSSASYRIGLALRTFYGNKYVSRTAYIDLDLIVADRTGRTIYKDAIKDERSEFLLFDADIVGLQKLVQALLNATIDRMLDKPGLRAVLEGRPPQGPPGS